MKRAVCLASALRGDSPGKSTGLPVTERLGSPGLCPDHPVLTAFLVDDSGSVVGPASNDPLSNRYAEIGRAVRAVRRWCYCAHERAAVIHFDTPTSACLAPRRLRGISSHRLATSLRTPPEAAGQSAVLPALVALDAYHAADPESALVTVILTDWDLFDEPRELEQSLAELPGQLIGVGLGTTERPHVLPPRADFIPITSLARPGAVARAVFEALKVHRTPLIASSDR